MLAGDALLDAWNLWANQAQELDGMTGNPSGMCWRFIRETRAICDATRRRRGLSPDLDRPIGVRRWKGEE